MLISNLHSSNVIGCGGELNQSGKGVEGSQRAMEGSQRVIMEDHRGVAGGVEEEVMEGGCRRWLQRVMEGLQRVVTEGGHRGSQRVVDGSQRVAEGDHRGWSQRGLWRVIMEGGCGGSQRGLWRVTEALFTSGCPKQPHSLSYNF